jgi:hypothetical protein
MLKPGESRRGVDAMIRLRVGRVIDLGRERPEAFLVGRDLTGERHPHHGAAVEGATERDNGRAPGERARS